MINTKYMCVENSMARIFPVQLRQMIHRIVLVSQVSYNNIIGKISLEFSIVESWTSKPFIFMGLNEGFQRFKGGNLMYLKKN